MGLENRVIAITGASSGIGAATARQLAAAGATVVLGARRLDRLKGLAAELKDQAFPIELDVRSPHQAQRFVSEAMKQLGRIDGLVCNAGIGAYAGMLGLDDEEVKNILETNLGGTIWAIRAVLTPMIEAGGGDIVIVSSVAGLLGGGDEAVYSATKFGQVGLARSLDMELRESGIRVTAICPGGVKTEFALGSGRTSDMPELSDMLEADDVASAVLHVLQQPRRVRTHLWWLSSMTEPT